MEQPVDEAAAILGWPFKDPEWPSKIFKMGLIWLALLFLPIVGVILASLNLNGWMLATLDNLRAGRRELPPAGLRYVRRGLRLFAVEFAYFAVLIVVSFALLGSGLFLSVQAGQGGSTPQVVIALLLTAFGQSVLILGSTVWVALTPAIILLTERSGPWAALDVRRLVAVVRSGPRGAVIAGLLALLCLDVIAPAGVFACGIGLVLTLPYAYAVLAATVEWYDRTEKTALRR